MIPRRVFWILDFLVLTVAYLTAVAIAPIQQRMLLPGGLFYMPWVASLSPAPLADEFPGFLQFLGILAALTPVTLIIMEALGGYGPLREQSIPRIVASGIFSQLSGLALLSLSSFVLKTTSFSRLVVLSFLALNILGLCGYRVAARLSYVRRLQQGLHAKDVALIGPADMVESIEIYLEEKIAGGEFRVAGYFAVESEHHKPVWRRTGVLPLLGSVDELGEVLVHNVIEHVIAIIPRKGASWLTQVIENCDYFRIHTDIVPGDLLTLDLQDLRYVHTGSFSLPALTLTATDFDSEALFLKRCLDVILSGALLIALSPLLVLIALLIKVTTPHLPILYHWRVVGCKGRRFTGFKFTTMDADSDASQNASLPNNEMSGPVFKLKDDHRVTPLGRILRKFSLNELPQLWSVFNGDMSLVGPRPAFPHELERYEMWHKRKLSVRPGITCLWQIRGRNKISNFDDWVRMDLEYIQNWSLGLDVSILCRTVWVVVRGTGS